MELTGVTTDKAKYKTRSIDGNGLCPVWNDKCGPWDVSMPELASLGFVVYNTDMFGDPHPIAQRFFPIGSKQFTCIRQVSTLPRLVRVLAAFVFGCYGVWMCACT